MKKRMMNMLGSPIRSAGRTMRRRLFIFFVSFTIIMLVGFFGIWVLAGRFAAGAQETEQLLNQELGHLSQNASRQYGEALMQAARMSEALSDGIEEWLAEAGIDPSELSAYPELLKGVEESQISPMLVFLDNTDCSGVFMVLDASVSPMLRGAHYSKAGLYIRNIEPHISGVVTSERLLLRGFAQFARGSLSMQAKWDLEFDVRDQPFWSEPIAAYENDPSLGRSRYVYWSATSALADLDERVTICSAPLVDSRGNVFGVAGFEISATNFTARHEADMSVYPRKVVAMGAWDGAGLALDTALFAGNATVYGAFPGGVTLHPVGSVAGMTVYEAGGASYVGVDTQIRLYPTDSPFASQRFAMVAAIPKGDYEDNVSRFNTALAMLVAVLLVVGVGVSYGASRSFVKPITDQLAYLERLDAAEGGAARPSMRGSGAGDVRPGAAGVQASGTGAPGATGEWSRGAAPGITGGWSRGIAGGGTGAGDVRPGADGADAMRFARQAGTGRRPGADGADGAVDGASQGTPANISTGSQGGAPGPVIPKTNIQEVDALIEKLLEIHATDNPIPADLFDSFIAKVNNLTPTELVIFRYTIQGDGVDEIAERMFISRGTLANHNTRIFRKLDVSSKDELMVYADLMARCGLLGEIL
ncbi:MAG: LuxR C-terminal-related transcriptional regulator [Lachnospiraceae bacterium]|jgi:DNA-binding CsgD family transcriptional regulator|nr:LuxR C-terminal-related transcriptional regulator [Lachnospiraceae bacterium]